MTEKQQPAERFAPEQVAEKTEKLAVEPLITPCDNEFIQRITDAVYGLEAAVACGGSVTCTQPVQIKFTDSESASIEKKVLELPSQGADETALTALAAACSAATFGIRVPSIDKPKETYDVLDPIYRKARRLNADEFGVTLNLEEMGILTQIKALLAPNAIELRAELHKLNIHREGDFFKTHVDRPHSESMVGVLVIALPSIHDGGKLTLEHGGKKQEFDWSLKDLPETPVVRWAAFYSDCTQEVHKVSSGTRITVIYNLMALPASPPLLKEINPGSPALDNLLEEALANPDFLKDGMTLGFACRHVYPHKDKTFRNRHLQFKGADACLVAAAHNVGLTVFQLRDSKPSWLRGDPNDAKEEDHSEENADQEEAGAPDPADYLLSLKNRKLGDGCDDSLGVKEGVEPQRKVIWCDDIKPHAKDYARRYYDQSPGVKGELAPIYIAHGNENSLACVYSYITICIDIPRAAERAASKAFVT